MSISITEIWEGRRTRRTKDLQREHVRVFRAVTDSAATSGVAVGTALAITPWFVSRGAAHPDDAAAYCADVTFDNISEDRLTWMCRAEYTTSLLDSAASPTTRPTVYSWTNETVEKGIGEDLDGATIENSAHELFENPATSKVAVDVIKATFISSSYIPTTDKDPYIFHVNSVGVTCGAKLYQSGQLYVDDFLCDMIEEAGAWFYKKTYTFKGRQDADLVSTSTTTTTSSIVASGSAQSVTVASVAGIAVGDTVTIDTEPVTVLSVGGSFFTAVCLFDHGAGVTVTISTNSPWQYQPLDMGFSTYDITGNKNIPILNQGQPLTVPALLDGRGHRLPVGGTPVNLLFRNVPSVDLTALIASFP